MQRPRLPALRRRHPAAGSSTATTSTSAEPTGAASSGAADAPALLPVADVPEVRDTGDGRATAALRAVLQAYGIAFDAAAPP